MLTLLAVVLLPFAMGGVAFAVRSDRVRPRLLPLAGALHLALTLLALSEPAVPAGGGAWLGLDPPGRVVLLLVSVLFLLCSAYAVGYLALRAGVSNRTFCCSLLGVLGAMSLVICSRHLGLMWVAIEASTLLAAPLVYYRKTPQSIEATWKYLMVGSVGVALALLGSFFLAYASLHAGFPASLLVDDLLRAAPKLSKPWVHAAFVLLLVGYGTKMGIAPLHTWKPDAYGEAPGIAGALLAGGLTNCAFLALLRVQRVTVAAGEGAYSGGILVFMGLLSMAAAAVFMAGQKDFKRLLAYSSVEHMGILTLGLGLGGAALFGTMFHLLNNGLNKGVLFLAAANIHRAYDSKSTDEVSGALRRLPLSGALFLFGFLAITGSPPFGPFASEFAIASAAFGMGRFAAGGLFLLLLMAVFLGFGQTVLKVVQGRPPHAARFTGYRDGLLTAGPSVVCLALLLLLGLWIPAPLEALLRAAAEYAGAGP